MSGLVNPTLILFLVAVGILGFWQWRKTRRMHRDFTSLPESERKEILKTLHMHPIRNAYVRPFPKLWAAVLILFTILLGGLALIQKLGN
jgi:hypothetical protein